MLTYAYIFLKNVLVHTYLEDLQTASFKAVIDVLNRATRDIQYVNSMENVWVNSTNFGDTGFQAKIRHKINLNLEGSLMSGDNLIN